MWAAAVSTGGAACGTNAPLATDEGGTQQSAQTDAADTADAPTPAPQTETGASGAESNDGTTATPPTTDAADSTDTTDGPPGKPEEGVVRFIAMGDGGEGNTSQYLVAGVVEDVCADRGCEFALYLGDNFYDSGVDSAMDVQFTDKFEMPYANLDLPFYITLGNHDYDLLGNAWWKSTYQVEYSEFSDKWTLPSEFYSFDAGHVRFIGLDTAQLFWNHEIDAQRSFVQNVLANNERRFTVAFGHHPFISNGQHGNAGNYEGFPIPIVGGADVRDFFEDEVCNQVTVYICGHDHNRQWFPTHCGTQFLVVGTAAKNTDFEHRDDNPVPYFEDDTIPGFAWIEIANEEMTVAWYDENGTLNFEDTIVLPEN